MKSDIFQSLALYSLTLKSNLNVSYYKTNSINHIYFLWFKGIEALLPSPDPRLTTLVIVKSKITYFEITYC